MKNIHTLLVLTLFTSISPSFAAVLIDFETTPAGGTPTDDGILPFTTPYIFGGVQIAFGFDSNTDGIVDGDPRFELAGTFPGEFPNGGFEGSSGADTADPGFGGQLGSWFLRSPVGGSNFGHFIIQYSSTIGPVTAASGEIWDIDGIPQQPATEEYTVQAFDSANNLLDTLVSPLGVIDTPTAPLDGRPWTFAFSGLTAGIDHIVVDFTGSKTMGIGLAFNNFYPLSVPEPTTMVMLGMLGAMATFVRRRS